MLAMFSSVSTGPWFTFRNAVKEAPFMFVGFLLALLNTVSAYALREAERQAQEAFGFFWNALWCSMVTITTVGYGDLFPITHPGRVVAVTACLLGTAILALLITSVFDAIQFDNAEQRMQRMLYKSRLRRDLKNVSPKLITDTIRLCVARKRMAKAQLNDPKLKNVQSRGSVINFVAQLPVPVQLQVSAAQRLQETQLHRSVRAFRDVSRELRIVTRNEDADPTLYLAAAISNLQDAVQKNENDRDVAVWRTAVDNRLDLIQGSFAELLRRSQSSAGTTAVTPL
jgi:hypothetical protein